MTQEAEPYLRKTVELWRQSTGTGTGYGWVTGQGQYPGKDVGLQVITGKGEKLALWMQIGVYMSKQDFDPQFFTTGQAYIDCEVPMMWVTETPI